jgi:hypothetical protein
MGSFDPTWGRFKSLIHPVPGNHEYRTDPTAAGYYQYFGAAAGDPAKGYYSYDIGDWHLVALNSDCGNAGCDGSGAHVSDAEIAWLQADLAAHRTGCTLAYWHHPLFGDANGGDNPAVKSLFQAFYASGGDIVLNGHDHAYERWAQQNADGIADPKGPTQIVVGTGGDDLLPASGQRPLDKYLDASRFGVLFLTLGAARADWRWTTEDGIDRDPGGVWCHAPQAIAAADPAAPAATTATTFDAAASTDHYGVALTTYAWDFGDGTSAQGSKVDHAYATPGTYTAVLTVTNADGKAGRASRDVVVGPPPPVTTSTPAETTTTASSPPAADGGAAPPADPGAALGLPLPAAPALAPRLRLFEVGITRRVVRRGTTTAFRYRLSRPARVQIRIQRRVHGRWVTLATFTRNATAGRARAAFDGRVRGRLLAPGSYRASLTATAAGRRTPAALVPFRLVAR